MGHQSSNKCCPGTNEAVGSLRLRLFTSRFASLSARKSTAQQLEIMTYHTRPKNEIEDLLGTSEMAINEISRIRRF
jgi:hypothetical protein